MEETEKHAFSRGSGCSLLLSLCLLTLLNRLFAPLQQIAATSRSIASGDLQGGCRKRGKDEVAAMAGSFNEMASTIQRQIAALQEAAEEKQRLVDNFAHELRTPLTGYLRLWGISPEGGCDGGG